MQTAFLDLDGYQRGYRTSGQICSAVAVIEEQAAGRPSAVITDVPKPSITSSMRMTDMLGQQFPKVRHMLLDAKEDLTAFAAFPISHWKKIQTPLLNSPWLRCPVGDDLPCRHEWCEPWDGADVDAAGGAACGSAGDSEGGPAAFPAGSLPIRLRDRLEAVFADEPYADAFGVRGAPGLSPAVLSLVTVLQFTEDLTDRQAAAMAVRAIDWKAGNVARTPEGPVLLDFERASVGPPEWDLVSTAVKMTTTGAVTEAE